MALALNGSVSNHTSGLTTTLTLTIHNNDVCIVFFGVNGSGTTPTCTSPNFTWTARYNSFSSAGIGESFGMFYAVNTSGSDKTSEVITIAGNALVTFVDGTAFNVSGANTSSPFDGSNVNFGTNHVAPFDPLTITTTNANTMVVGGWRFSSTGTPTAGSGYTGISIGASSFFLAEYQIFSSPQTSLSVTVGTGVTNTNGGAADAIVAAAGVSAVSLVAGAPILGTPVMGVFSTLVLGSSVLDFGLNRLHTNANFLYICSTVPTTYVQATTTYAIGSASVAAGTLFGAMGNGSPSGRIVNSAVISAGAVTGNGTPVCWAVIDSVNSDLLASGPAAGFSAVTSGQTWQLGSFDVHMSNT